MLRHVVMFKFKDNAEGRGKTENIAITKDMLEALPSMIPQIKRSEVHVAASAEGEFDYDLLLVSDFDNADELAIYLDHPEHKKVGAFMRPVRISRACVDYIID